MPDLEKARARVRRYALSEKGIEAQKRYNQSDACKAKRKRYYESDKGQKSAKLCCNRANKTTKRLLSIRRYQQTEKGKATKKRARIKYLQTDKGRAAILKHRDTWHYRSEYLIFVLMRPCAVCGETNVELLECDHILARCLGGTDDWSNLQVLCITHHKEKTAIDLIKYRSMEVV